MAAAIPTSAILSAAVRSQSNPSLSSPTAAALPKIPIFALSNLALAVAKPSITIASRPWRNRLEVREAVDVRRVRDQRPRQYKVAVSCKTRTQKLYRRHSGKPGGMKVKIFNQLQQRIPKRIIAHAVQGILPKGRLGRTLFTHLVVC